MLPSTLRNLPGRLACLSLLVALPSITTANPLAAVIERALADDPELRAAQAAVAAAEARQAGAAKPLNNPELALDGEHGDTTTVTIGLAQTLDWHDKRGALRALADTAVETARAELTLLRHDKSAALLRAIGRVVTLRRIVALSTQRVETMQRFAELAEKRHRAGDIAGAEWELARLSLTEATIERARHRAALAEAEGDYRGATGQPPPERVALPTDIGHLPTPNDDDRHPRLYPPRLALQAARQQVEAADRQRKTDPTVGIAAGREDEQSVIGLHLSLPLRVRNRYDDEVEATRAEALQARQRLRQIERSLDAERATAGQRHRLMAGAWRHWRDEGEQSLTQRIALLEKLWRAGEIGSTDYLLQVQQTLDTRIAAVELHGDLWDAWVGWLAASGQLLQWLGTDAEGGAR